MKEVTVTKVGVGSFGKLLGFANAIVSLIVGVLAAIVTTSNVIAQNDLGLFQGVLAALVVVGAYLIIVPALAFVLGWLYGAVLALVWNVFLGASNGLDLEIVDRKK